MKYPDVRPRRLRYLKQIRDSVAETTLSPCDFIVPIFVDETIDSPKEISAMPGYYRYPVEHLESHINMLLELGLKNVILFGIPKTKDDLGSSAYASDGIIQRAIRMIKKWFGDEVIVFTDVCLCEYTSHGHCGIISKVVHGGIERWFVDNDVSLNYLVKTAISHAEAGADVVAPSNMMDGVVGAIRKGLDDHGFKYVGIMSYAVKYASSFYGPFREAAESAPTFGDRRSYQMDPRNKYEALKEASLDIDEGADILMVKPALPYLDVIHLVKSSYPWMPLAAYNVSGEYLMVKAASSKGYMDGDKGVMEVLYSIKRAGADLILTYHASEAARLLREGYNPF